MVKSTAVLIGSNGGIGQALHSETTQLNLYDQVVAFERRNLDINNENNVADAAESLKDQNVRLVINATGFLHNDGVQPEKGLRQIDSHGLAHYFAVNAIGPALLMKHFLPILPRSGRAVFVCLSARVGSISDNKLGGWYGYRSSKAALNQLIRTAAVELQRTHPEAICVALHPGTVSTKLSAPFLHGKTLTQQPTDAARQLMRVITTLGKSANGGFIDWRGKPIPW